MQVLLNLFKSLSKNSKFLLSLLILLSITFCGFSWLTREEDYWNQRNLAQKTPYQVARYLGAEIASKQQFSTGHFITRFQPIEMKGVVSGVFTFNDMTLAQQEPAYVPNSDQSWLWRELDIEFTPGNQEFDNLGTSRHWILQPQQSGGCLAGWQDDDQDHDKKCQALVPANPALIGNNGYCGEDTKNLQECDLAHYYPYDKYVSFTSMRWTKQVYLDLSKIFPDVAQKDPYFLLHQLTTYDIDWQGDATSWSIAGSSGNLIPVYSIAPVENTNKHGDCLNLNSCQFQGEAPGWLCARCTPYTDQQTGASNIWDRNQINTSLAGYYKPDIKTRLHLNVWDGTYNGGTPDSPSAWGGNFIDWPADRMVPPEMDVSFVAHIPDNFTPDATALAAQTCDPHADMCSDFKDGIFKYLDDQNQPQTCITEYSNGKDVNGCFEKSWKKITKVMNGGIEVSNNAIYTPPKMQGENGTRDGMLRLYMTRVSDTANFDPTNVNTNAAYDGGADGANTDGYNPDAETEFARIVYINYYPVSAINNTNFASKFIAAVNAGASQPAGIATLTSDPALNGWVSYPENTAGKFPTDPSGNRIRGFTTVPPYITNEYLIPFKDYIGTGNKTITVTGLDNKSYTFPVMTINNQDYLIYKTIVRQPLVTLKGSDYTQKNWWLSPNFITPKDTVFNVVTPLTPGFGVQHVTDSSKTESLVPYMWWREGRQGEVNAVKQYDWTTTNFSAGNLADRFFLISNKGYQFGGPLDQNNQPTFGNLYRRINICNPVGQAVDCFAGETPCARNLKNPNFKIDGQTLVAIFSEQSATNNSYVVFNCPPLKDGQTEVNCTPATDDSNANLITYNKEDEGVKRQLILDPNNPNNKQSGYMVKFEQANYVKSNVQVILNPGKTECPPVAEIPMRPDKTYYVQVLWKDFGPNTQSTLCLSQDCNDGQPNWPPAANSIPDAPPLLPELPTIDYIPNQIAKLGEPLMVKTKVFLPDANASYVYTVQADPVVGKQITTPAGEVNCASNGDGTCNLQFNVTLQSGVQEPQGVAVIAKPSPNSSQSVPLQRQRIATFWVEPTASTKPATPVVDTPIAVTATTATITWKEEGITDSYQFTLKVTDDNGKEVFKQNVGKALTYSVSNLSAYTHYNVEVIATDSNSPEEPSDPGKADFTTLEQSKPATPEVTIGNITANTAEVSWTEEGQTENYSYAVTVKDDAGTTVWQQASITATPVTVSGATIKPSTHYTVTVVATDSSSQQSSEPGTKDFTTAEAPKPATPVVAIADITANSAEVSWTEAGQTENYSYAVTVKDDAGTTVWQQANITATQVTISSDAIKPNTHYTVAVVATDSSSQQSSEPGTKDFTTAEAPKPATPEVAIGDITANSAEVSWTEAGQTENYSYKVTVTDNNGSIVWQQLNITTNEATVSGNSIKPNTHYTVAVVATDSSSQQSSEPGSKDFTTAKLPAPAVPVVSVPTETITTTSAKVEWTEQDATANYSYDVTVKDDAGATVWQQANITAAQVTVSGDAIKPNTHYTVAVVARDSSTGESSTPGTSEFTTKSASGVITAPTVLQLDYPRRIPGLRPGAISVGGSSDMINGATITYYIQIINLDDPNKPVVYSGKTQTSPFQTAPCLLAGGTYKVVAWAEDQFGNKSPVISIQQLILL